MREVPEHGPHAIERRIQGEPRFSAIDRAVGAEGLKIVFLMRLSPAFPFVFLNYALGLTRVKLSDYAVMDNNWYAFSTPDGLTCVLQKGNGYGCSGPIPGAPEGANLVSGSYGGVPGFASSPANVSKRVSQPRLRSCRPSNRSLSPSLTT